MPEDRKDVNARSKAKWEVVAEGYYDYCNDNMKVHIKAIRRKGSDMKGIVFVRLAVKDEFGRLRDSERSFYPLEPEGLACIGHAVISFAEELARKEASEDGSE